MIHKKIINLLPGINLQTQHANTPQLTGPLHLNVDFYIEPSKSMSLKKRQALYGQPHLLKPDLDNLIKFINDISSGIVFVDDAIVSSITSRKIYDSVPRTEFYYKEIK